MNEEINKENLEGEYIHHLKSIVKNDKNMGEILGHANSPDLIFNMSLFSI